MHQCQVNDFLEWVKGEKDWEGIERGGILLTHPLQILRNPNWVAHFEAFEAKVTTERSHPTAGDDGGARADCIAGSIQKGWFKKLVERSVACDVSSFRIVQASA